MITTTLLALYTNTKSLLKLGGIPNYAFEAKQLLGRFIGIRPTDLATRGAKKVEISVVNSLKAGIEKRVAGYPLQYILGEWEFYGMTFEVGEGVLIPRADTETLVEAAINFAKKMENPAIADLCSGSGCVAIAIAEKLADGVVSAVEYSTDALGYLNRNILHNRSRVRIIRGDVLTPATTENFELLDLIVCNPPYLTADDIKNLQKEVTFEPQMALYGGEDGLYFYREITAIWKFKLVHGGKLLFEVGAGQDEAVVKILEGNGFSDIGYEKDLAGIIRIVYGTNNT